MIMNCQEAGTFKGETVTYWKALWSGRGTLRPRPQVAWLILEPDIAGFRFRCRGISLHRQDTGDTPSALRYIHVTALHGN